ncbi:MAG: ABC transporter substrate-binding protein [Bacillota bacterium]
MKRILALLVVMALLAGCGGTKQPSGGGSAPAAAKEIKIGLIAPLTGDVKTFGESTKNGFELALEQVNYKVGDITIKTVIGDDRNDPTEGVNLATKFITQDKVQAIIGSVTSKVTIPVTEVANQNKVVLVTGTATNEKVTVGEKGRKDYIFRACFIDSFQGEVGAKFALNTLKVKTAAVLYDKGNDYTVGLAENFKKNFEAGGGKVVGWEAYSKDDTDFSAVLTKLAGQKPEMLYLPDYYNKVSLIGKQAKAKGLNVPMIGGDGWDSSDIDWETMAGGYFTNHYSADDQRPEVQKFVKEYEAKYKVKPDALAALAYDATLVLLEGIRQSKSTDATKIREAIQTLKDFTAVSGKITYDKNGNPIKSAAILQVQANKSLKFIESVKP